MKLTIILAAILLSMPALAQEQPEQPDQKAYLQAPRDYVERCKNEGGCRIYTLQDLKKLFYDVQVDALHEGFRQGLQEGIQQGCRRKDSV